MRQLMVVMAVVVVGLMGCGVQEDEFSASSEVNSSEETSEAAAQGVTAVSSCQSMYTRRCDGSQFSKKEYAKSYCDRFCSGRGYPSCAHLYTSCGWGVGVTCRCRVPFGGVQ